MNMMATLLKGARKDVFEAYSNKEFFSLPVSLPNQVPGLLLTSVLDRPDLSGSYSSFNAGQILPSPTFSAATRYMFTASFVRPKNQKMGIAWIGQTHDRFVSSVGSDQDGMMTAVLNSGPRLAE